VTNYLVVGMHRSGTSLVSELLHSNNIDMGEGHFADPGEDNPRGYFEDQRFREINDRLLKFSRYDVKSWKTPIPPCKTNKTLTRQIRGVLGHSREGSWGVKDPRFCLTWEMWWKWLPKDTHVVYVYRNPLAVTSSLIARGNVKTVNEGLLIWTAYNERALPIRKHYKTTFVQYEELLETGRIPGISLPDTSIIDRSLQHHTQDETPYPLFEKLRSL